MIDPTKIKLGKQPARTDPRTLKFSKYLPSSAPASPQKINWLKPITWQMYGNDTLGDCVEAAAGHMINIWQSWTAPTTQQPTSAQIIEAYSGDTGYIPGDPNTDRGTDMLSFLNYWRKTGVAGLKIAAYVALDTGDLEQMRQAVYLFGAAFIGLQMPISAQGAESWEVPPSFTGTGAPGSWGGHCVPVGAFNEFKGPANRNTVVTWGQTLPMADGFYPAYSDEGYAVLSDQWIEANAKAPNSFNLAALQADIAAL
jgi:hypothetical protein